MSDDYIEIESTEVDEEYDMFLNEDALRFYKFMSLSSDNAYIADFAESLKNIALATDELERRSKEQTH